MVTPTLVWPDLDLEAAMAARRLPARFKRAVKRDISAQDSLELAAVALGIETPPAGALARLADGLAVEGRNWFRAAPVTLIPDRDRLVMLPMDEDALDADEMDALASAARAHFDSTLALERGASGRWYAALADVRDATARAPAAVAGTPIDILSMASGADAAALRRFLNELQMLWYEHPVNRARRNAGRREANALWLWGGGYLPAKCAAREPVKLHAGSPEMTGLAIRLGFDRLPLGAPGADAPAGDALVAIEADEAPIGEAWLGAFAALRSEFLVYTAGAEWRIPARRGLRNRLGW